ncbi:MAG: hypothetical protein ACTHMM_00710 [Agriterribacter sp.]
MNIKGKYISFTIKGRKDKIRGIVLNLNKDWTLIKTCIDYTVDGYTIFRNINVKHEYGEFERRANKILLLKKYDYRKEPRIPIDSLPEIIAYIDKHHKLIQVDTKDGKAFDVLKLKYIENNIYFLDELLTNAKWRDVMEFKENIFRIISFDNDYLNSLKLITKFKKK